MTYIPAVTVAAHLRTRLKAAFPGSRFSVRTRHGATIDIAWFDGPPQDQVRPIVKGIAPVYDESDCPSTLAEITVQTKTGAVTGKPCVNFLFLHRRHSPALLEQAGRQWQDAAGRPAPDARAWLPALTVRGYRVPDGTAYFQLGVIADRILADASAETGTTA